LSYNVKYIILPNWA